MEDCEPKGPRFESHSERSFLRNLEFDRRKCSLISWLLSLQHLNSRWLSPDKILFLLYHYLLTVVPGNQVTLIDFPPSSFKVMYCIEGTWLEYMLLSAIHDLLSIPQVFEGAFSALRLLLAFPSWYSSSSSWEDGLEEYADFSYSFSNFFFMTVQLMLVLT